ncbi:MAG TPA: hypothetical protein VEZ90_17480 [Blastocatellia bacterium]|nr:hypothetical protein [Blastocatellia bacterium]
MYRKPRFLEELHAIREEMSRECDYDIDLFVEMVRSGQRPGYAKNGSKPPAARAAEVATAEDKLPNGEVQ